MDANTDGEGKKRTLSDPEKSPPKRSQGKRHIPITECQLEVSSNMQNIPDELIEAVLQFIAYFKQRLLQCVSKRWKKILQSENIAATVLMDVYTVHEVVTRGQSADPWACHPKKALYNFRDSAIRAIIYDATIARTLPDPEDSDEYYNHDEYYDQIEHKVIWYRFLKSVVKRCPNLQCLVVLNANNCFQTIDTTAYPLSVSWVLMKSFGLRYLKYPEPVSVEDWKNTQYQIIPITFHVPHAEIKPDDIWSDAEINYAWPYREEQLVWLSNCVSQLAADSLWQLWLNKFHFFGAFGDAHTRQSRQPTEEEFELAFVKGNGSSAAFLQFEEWLTSVDFLMMSAYILARSDLCVGRPPQKFDFETEEFSRRCEEVNANWTAEK